MEIRSKSFQKLFFGNNILLQHSCRSNGYNERRRINSCCS
nr:unnamed protein product [Callosobruchus analis]